ncbi:heme peroxidase [Auriculariales sp. MPI-PUGE-AT-0066]|nr:heme peroxidase [Auriculariales sp. MPI-PUGE-AT-0066]
MRVSSILPVHSSALLVVVFAALSVAHKWPNPKLDVLEGMRWDQLGYNSFETALFVTPCTRYIHPDEKGIKGVRTNAGDWLRTAMILGGHDLMVFSHDMATHNSNTGEGGLDASIRLWQEQARPENLGDGFNNSVGFVAGSINRYFSLSDGLALLAVVAVENCGGPSLSYRGGRIDAVKPNIAGVPEPDQQLAAHTAAFARQGFNKTEMIGLVACGHTFGSVQSSNFPDVVKKNATDPHSETGAAFDKSIVKFDNNVAVEYVKGTTKNPLVVGGNATKNSDARIFASDRNTTMRAFARDAGHFRKTCKSLLERMIDTVPKSVKLTEVIQPLPAKPFQLKLTYLKNGTISLSGEVRLFNVTSNSQRTVALAWKGSAFGSTKVTRAAMPHKDDMVGSAIAGKIQNMWYGSKTSLAHIDVTRGFGEFWFEVKDRKGSAVQKENQNGAGFRLPTDKVMRTVNVAVHKSVHAKKPKVFIELDMRTADNQATAPSLQIKLAPTSNARADANGYIIYTTKMKESQWDRGYGIVAVVNGKRRELPHSELNRFC